MGRQRKLYSIKVGGYGHTVVVCERRAGGPLYLRWWDAAAGKRGAPAWRPLGHRDKELAQQEAREFSSQLLNATKNARSPQITLLELLARYEREVTAFRKPEQAREERRRIETWQHVAGDREARAIDFPTLDRFVRERAAGSIEVPGHKLRTPGKKQRNGKIAAGPSATTIGADIIFLNTVLNWATRVMLPNGTRLLSENPIRGYTRPKNKNPKQPVVTYDRFLKVRKCADSVDPQRLFGYFLDLVESLGWRVSAICGLWASDIDRRTDENAPSGRLRKRGELDKEGVEMWVPLSPAARSALDGILSVNPTIHDLPIFPAPKTRRGDRPGPWTRFHARNLLRRAEKRAGVDAIDGGDFHPYRRKWSTERKHLPARDVAEVGGWKDLRSLERSYQKADAATMLTVVTEPKKLREVASKPA
jgi:integrase